MGSSRVLRLGVGFKPRTPPPSRPPRSPSSLNRLSEAKRAKPGKPVFFCCVAPYNRPHGPTIFINGGGRILYLTFASYLVSSVNDTHTSMHGCMMLRAHLSKTT